MEYEQAKLLLERAPASNGPPHAHQTMLGKQPQNRGSGGGILPAPLGGKGTILGGSGSGKNTAIGGKGVGGILGGKGNCPTGRYAIYAHSCGLHLSVRWCAAGAGTTDLVAMRTAEAGRDDKTERLNNKYHNDIIGFDEQGIAEEVIMCGDEKNRQFGNIVPDSCGDTSHTSTQKSVGCHTFQQFNKCWRTLVTY